MSDANLPVARTIYLVDIDQIDPTGGLRPLNPAWVEALAALMDRDGQQEAIEIYPTKTGFGVTAGRHRLAAASLLGWKQIDADIQNRDRLDRAAREVSENLFRQELSPLDRAAFVAKQIEIERARAGVAEDATPQSVAAKARWSERLKTEAADASDIMSRAYGWTDQVAQSLGLNRRTIERDLELHRRLSPEVAAAIRTTPVASNASQLRALARMSETDQRLVTGLIVEGTAKGVTDAAAILNQKAVMTPADKAWSAFVGSWGRMNRATQRQALIEILNHTSTAPELKALLIHLEGAHGSSDLDTAHGRADRELVEPGASGNGADPGRRRPAQGVEAVGHRGGSRRPSAHTGAADEGLGAAGPVDDASLEDAA